MKAWRAAVLAVAMLAIAALAALPLVHAQPMKAGVVVTIEGHANAIRSSSPGPVPLLLDDDIFIYDRIITGDRAFARVLLGGKAILAIHERSAVTISEIPGKATIDLDAGAISLTVDTTKQRPGEMIEIRTANASAALVAGRYGSEAQREDSIFASVSRLQVGTVEAKRPASEACWPQSDFVVLRGVATVMALDYATGRVIQAPVKLTPPQTVTVSGCGIGPVGTLTRAEAEGLVQSYRIDDIPEPRPR